MANPIYQRRRDGDVSFYQDWDSYKNGFGDFSGDFWFGLEYVHKLTAEVTGTLIVAHISDLFRTVTLFCPDNQTSKIIDLYVQKGSMIIKIF